MIKDLIQGEIFIAADRATVWDALTNSEKTKVYMYGCDAITDWKVGSSLLWEGSYEGQRMVFVSGSILGLDNQKSLEYTVIDPNASYAKTAENHLKVKYMLQEKEDGTLLQVVKSGFSTVADGEKRYNDVYNNGAGWNPVLLQIKTLCENRD